MYAERGEALEPGKVHRSLFVEYREVQYLEL